MLINLSTFVARLGVFLCLLGVQVALNGPVLGEENLPKPTAITLDEVFAYFDADKNDVLEGDECACESSRACDLNKDRKISRDEFSEGVKLRVGSHEAALELMKQVGGIEKGGYLLQLNPWACLHPSRRNSRRRSSLGKRASVRARS